MKYPAPKPSVEPPITMPLNMILIKHSPLMITSDSFYMIHKDLLAEISEVFELSNSSSRGGARKGTSKTSCMLFVLSCAARFPFVEVEFLSQKMKYSQDKANKGILISAPETAISVLTVGDVSFRILQVPIIVVFTKYNQLLTGKKCSCTVPGHEYGRMGAWSPRDCYGGRQSQLREAPSTR
ncbi:hypothetical protein BS47DRAFT_887279 [Hydnum rufescens UP504]|uniref:Uncharacterized protein n=1 Tax=Hydnum rufescens UP504 TaxID=1448309 RepID=A0A9P6AY77_9AGAM|nr:hypothetical protein BS47DRAFT_887279 [Hydnum rufescens UP504]